MKPQHPAASTASATTVNQNLKGTCMANTDNWLGALRTESDRTSQAQAAQRIGCSGTTVSQVLSGTYAASTQRIERRVRGELMAAQCNCPVMGDVSTRVCQDVQERTPGKYGAGIGNPQHAQAWHACRGSGQFAGRGQCPQFNGAGAKPAVPTSTKPCITTAATNPIEA